MTVYAPPALLFNRHLETIYPSLMRTVEFRTPEPERITTPDDDFLDLDWYRQGSSTCVIISHGLEGNNKRAYVLGMARACYAAGFDVLAWNYRGCSDEMNRQLRFYHSGATDDLGVVVAHAATKYPQVALVGFSLGGNLTTKFMGEGAVPAAVVAAVSISAPLDLYASCIEIGKPGNWIYAKRFMRSLSKKIRAKARQRAELDVRHLDRIKTLKEFDDVYTGPLHGFQDAIDYYTRCSGLQFLSGINRPTLLISALNDPFLSSSCYPAAGALPPNVEMAFPQRGGHVGFAQFNEKGLYWSEVTTVSFLQRVCSSDTH